MATHKHYFIERRPDGRFAAIARGANRASRLFENQREAVRRVAEWNPHDRPDVERIRDTKTGRRDRWRAKDK